MHGKYEDSKGLIIAQMIIYGVILGLFLYFFIPIGLE